MQLLSGYAKPIAALAVSPDGKHLYSTADGQEMVWIWDLASGEVEEKLRGLRARNGVRAVAASPCGTWLVAGVNGNRVAGWRLPDREECRGWSPYSRAEVIAVSPKGPLVAVPGSRGTGRARFGFELRDLEARKSVKQRGHARVVSALAFSADGTTLATGSADRTVRLWDVDSRAELRVLDHKLVPNRVAFRPDGHVLATAASKSVFVWNVSDGSLAQTLTDHTGTVTGLAYSADGKYLASAGIDGVVIVRDAQTHEIVGVRHLGVGRIGVLVWRPDSSGVIAGGDKLIAVCALDDLLTQDKNAVRAARRDPQAPAVRLTGHTKKVVGVSFSADGQALASWTIRGGEIRLWDFSGGAGQAKETLTFTPAAFSTVRSVSWSPDRRHLALSLAHNSSGKLFSAETGEPVRTVKSTANQSDVYLGFTPGGHLLLASGTQQLSLTLLDAEGKKAIFSVKAAVGSGDHSNSAVAGPEDRNVYVGIRRDCVRWTPATGAVDVLFRQDALVGGPVVSPDEQLLVTTGGNSVLVWELLAARRRLELKHLLSISGIAFVPDNRLLTACYDGSVRLWDLTSGTELRQLDLGMGKIYCLAVAPDNLTFAVGVEKKNTVAVLDLPD